MKEISGYQSKSITNNMQGSFLPVPQGGLLPQAACVVCSDGHTRPCGLRTVLLPEQTPCSALRLLTSEEDAGEEPAVSSDSDISLIMAMEVGLSDVELSTDQDCEEVSAPARPPGHQAQGATVGPASTYCPQRRGPADDHGLQGQGLGPPWAGLCPAASGTVPARVCPHPRHTMSPVSLTYTAHSQHRGCRAGHPQEGSGVPSGAVRRAETLRERGLFLNKRSPLLVADLVWGWDVMKPSYSRKEG
ncbi:RING finger protein 150 [Galemys pyrenaicus]|uniref:RING finger protein 150 n=1 Tax=Galemys pyrenaicus TaxID=202257 RepID=A0A8J6DVC8_GALPY|nr:RING finger protein 150 [Galemys pyrenaicus]